MTFAIPFPNIDPVLIEIGPFALRWYALAYIAGLILAWWYVRHLAKAPPQVASANDVDDFLVWATIGVVLGGRVGYIVFYNFDFYVENPLRALEIWRGGMSFHGGMLGVIVAILLFCRKRNIPIFGFADLIACATPIGLFLGRIANFINAELFGRPTGVPWAMIFPGGGPIPRHPSQLYQAFLEGLVLFVVLYLLWRSEWVRMRFGTLSGTFLSGYGIFRIISEFFREPDVHIGFLAFGTTMGQWLSLPMVMLGAFLVFRARQRS
jgi:phosphatidylglycerol---prolipoprotein diacylglyceryl transferase